MENEERNAYYAASHLQEMCKNLRLIFAAIGRGRVKPIMFVMLF